MADRRGSRVIFFDAGIGELGKARPGDEAGFGQHGFENGLHGGSAQKHGFLAAAPVQNAVGEDVAALEIGAELNLVDGEERHLDVGRHGLDGCHPIARGGGDDFFLAGDEGHGVIAGFQRHPVIDFPGQKPEAAGRSCRRHEPACAPPPNGFCRYWWGPIRW